jgi:ribosomal protein S18 acetylase RimI-like enzyme
MIRIAVRGDEEALEAFLAGHPASSMFLRSNLAAHGLGASEHRHATGYHLYPASGPIKAVLGLTRSGMVLCQTGGLDQAVPVFAQALAGQIVTGFSGEAGQIGALMAALRLDPARDFRMDHVEPLFRLDLAEVPEGDDAVRPARTDEVDLLTGWFTAYMQDTGLGAGDPAAGIAEARDRALAAVQGSSVWLLEEKGQPVAMAALNAQAGDMVQVGGVYVPPPRRNQGLGRRVTRALLAETARKGARAAVLFANNDAAARAYRGIGFRQIGQYRIAFLHASRRTGVA